MIEFASVAELRAELSQDAALIDVREPSEYARGHVPGARLVPLATVPSALSDLPADRPLFVICEVGSRSAQAAAFLRHHGFDARNVEGGTQEWIAAGYPVEH